MNTKRARNALLITSVTASIALAASQAGTAMAVGHNATRPALAVSRAVDNMATASACSEALATRSLSTDNFDRRALTPARSDAMSRLSGLPFGGAAAYNPEIDGMPPKSAVEHSVARPALASGLSGLPFGGAADCV